MTADLAADLADTGTPLSIHDAEWALYAVDANDTVLSQLAAGFAERMGLDGEFARKPLLIQGAKFSRVWHDDESHTIDLHRPVFIEALPERRAAFNLPSAMRNQRCGLVVRWMDAESGVWWKRSYFGVSLQPVKVEGDGGGGDGGHHRRQIMHATLRMRAERMAEAVGSGSIPGMNLVSTGEVRYLSGAESLTLYTYTEDAFTPADETLLATRAQIDFDGTPGAVVIGFAGTPALRLDADGAHAKAFDASGPTYGTGTRLEFWVAGVRRATLQADGTLVAPSLLDGDPEEDSAMRFTNPAGDALLSIGAACYAPGFSDDL